MKQLTVNLFGKFSARCDEQSLDGLDSSKVQEFFCYLLLYRNRPHAREALAGMLWGDGSTTAQTKKYLRQALWQLQSALDSEQYFSGSPVLLIEADWIQLNPKADLWLDVETFEQAFTLVQGKSVQSLDAQGVESVRRAVQLYQGDLLEGVYQDWCIYERERLQNIYLALLDKLTVYCEINQEYEAGLAYALLTLRYDRARERTHRRLMRLHYLAGDRSTALRQYERCVAALAEELGVKPDKRTLWLYEQICQDCLDSPAPPPTKTKTGVPIEPAVNSLTDVISRLKHLQTILLDVQRQVQQEIETAEIVLNR